MHVAIEGEGTVLADALAELASLSVEPFDVAAMVHVACDRAVEVLDVDGAVLLLSVDGVTLDVAGQAGAVGDESRLAATPDRPCLEVLRTGVPHVTSVDAVDQQFPRYPEALRAMELCATAELPLRHGESIVGVFAMIRVTGDPFDAMTVANGQRMADVVAASIVREQHLRAALAVSAQLEHALQARVVVEQAKGMVAAELGVSIQVALEMIRQFARRQHLRMADVALDIVERRLPIGLLRYS